MVQGALLTCVYFPGTVLVPILLALGVSRLGFAVLVASCWTTLLTLGILGVSIRRDSAVLPFADVSAESTFSISEIVSLSHLRPLIPALITLWFQGFG